MIGADEFNVHKSQSASQSTGDIDDMEFIETFLATSSRDQFESGLLIDIVCPQPRSQRGMGMSARKGRGSQKSTKSGRK